MKRYEYRQLRPKEEEVGLAVEMLDQLGEDGWLLVHVSTRSWGAHDEIWTLAREKLTTELHHKEDKRRTK